MDTEVFRFKQFSFLPSSVITFWDPSDHSQQVIKDVAYFSDLPIGILPPWGSLYEGLDRQLVTIQARLPKGYEAAPGRRRI
jgi:hypothetical protein